MSKNFSAQTLRKLGWIGFITGILGVLSVIPMLTWPPQVEERQLSYPFTINGFYVIQSWFFVHHIGLVAVLVALAKSGAVGSRSFACWAAWLSVAGMIMLTFMELYAMQFAGWETKAANEGVMGVGYGISTTIIGLGLLGSGVGVLRARVWSGWRKWIPLILGIELFVLVTPLMFGGYVLARIAIASWMALYAALGWSILTEARQSY